MPLFIPFLIGAGGTGFWWWKSSQEEDEAPNLKDDLINVAKYSGIAILAILVIRWAWKKTRITNAPK